MGLCKDQRLSSGAWLLFLFAVVACCPAGSRAWAAAIFFGPTPYRSAADSPFPLSGDNSQFFLEDFEDGALNSPGIIQPLLPTTHAQIRSPGPTTESVDGDGDSAIDGVGNTGYSLESNFFIFQPTDPPRSTSLIRLAFARVDLGGLPTYFGFVWTHGISNSTVSIAVFDGAFNNVGRFDSSAIGGDSSGSGDDRFFGVDCAAGIGVVEISSTYETLPSAFQIDHVQYGGIVPEPTGELFEMGFAQVMAFRYSVARRRQAISRSWKGV